MGSGEGTKTVRPRIAAMEKGPGPARYSLPSLTGSVRSDITKKLNPVYSFGRSLGASFLRKDFGPGPCHTINPSVTYRGPGGAPHHSLASRHKELIPFNTPGPGTYAPESKYTCYQGEKQMPSFSMGTRSRYRKGNVTPSPSSYILPSMIGPRVPNRASSACYSMPGRISVGGFDTDYAKTPGPARYNATMPDFYQNKSPTYTMLSRNFMPGDGTKKPGPGAHSPEKVMQTQRKSPSYSLGTKHSEFLYPLILEPTN